MADVSGLVISTLAISFEIASTFYSYGKQVKGARKEIQALGNELYGLIGVLEHLKYQNEPMFLEDEETLVDKSEYLAVLPSSSRSALSGSKSTAETSLMSGSQSSEIFSVLKQTLEFLQELQKSLNEPKGRLAVAVHLLKWPLKQSDMEKHLKRIERVKTFFLLALMSDEITQSRKIYDEITALRTLIEESGFIQKDQKLQREYMDVLRWLSSVDPNRRRKEISQTRTQGTGLWFTESPAVLDWINISSSGGETVWLNGITGAGKSTLMTATVDRLLLSEPDRRDLAFFYCSFSDDQSLQTTTVLGSLLAQTLLPLDPAYTEAKVVYDDLCSKSIGKPGRMDPATLAKLLRMQDESRGHLYILIDGLNECGNPEEILDALEEATKTSVPIRIFISSINEKGIGNRLSHFPSLSVQSLRPGSVKPDIAVHVENALATQPRLRQLPSTLKSEIKHALTQGAQGMFRWVQCQLEILSRLRTPRAIREALETMPQTLDQTYEAMLLRIDKGEDADLSKQIFELLAFSLNPLTLLRITEYLQITPGLGRLDESRMLCHPTDILSICGSFLEYNPKTEIVTLAHHSVKTYLVSSLPASVTSFHLDETTAHRNIALACLTYISFADISYSTQPIKRSAAFRNVPFLNYAVMQWPLHLREVPNLTDRDPLLWTTLQDFLFGQSFRTWVQLLIPGSSLAPTTAPLYYAASFGLTNVVRYLLAMPDVNIEQKGGWGGATPINIASFRVSDIHSIVLCAI